jgi:ATPase subunit of ABC transporter with duplicated ATPase domains
VAEDLTQRFGGTIRVSILQSADLQEYKTLIADALKGSGMKHGMAAERITQSLAPAELARAVSQQDHATIAEKAGQDEERAKKIIETLRTSGAIYAIESVEIEDLPRIELRDGASYKDSPNLSTGQRCTTILPILLVQSERPLLVDQPEDNLDNAFIYETIVKALRAAKGTRQVIFVTHNPNIPVLGEAERIFVLHSDGKRAVVKRAGTVDECKNDIETILEGGREAFLRRKERYGH